MKHFFVILYIYLTTLASYEVRNYGYYILYYVFPSKKNITLLCMRIETHDEHIQQYICVCVLKFKSYLFKFDFFKIIILYHNSSKYLTWLKQYYQIFKNNKIDSFNIINIIF